MMMRRDAVNGFDGLTTPDFGQSDIELIVSRVMMSTSNELKPVVATISGEMMAERMLMRNASFRGMM